jgi:hypothetical protein
MLQLLKVRRGRKAALAAIAPWVEGSRHRLNGIPVAAFIDPYMVGFLSVLITLSAKQAIRSIGTHDLGLVQSGAWAELTGMSADLFGEEICYLSAMQHRDFVDGCINAFAFAEALHGRPAVEADLLQAWAVSHRRLDEEGDAAEAAGDASELWERYFDNRISVDTAAPDWTDRL